jgi:endonuclease YncB( thermonuclease family)
MSKDFSVAINKKHRILIGIAFVLLFTGIALATSSHLSASSSDVVIYAFDQNPAGSDKGNEWVTLYNPSNESVDIGNWILETTHGLTVTETIPEGTMLNPRAYYIYKWLDNEDESIILKDSEGNEVERTPILSDAKDDNRCWVRKDSEWIFEVKEEFGKPTPIPSYTPTPINASKLGESGIVVKVVDGDTFDVEGIGRIRLADVNTPEIDTEEGKEAKEYVKALCDGKKVYLDIDDLSITGKYGRIVAVVYIPYNKTHLVNLNQLLLKEGYAEARDYPNEFNPDVWQRSSLEYIALTLSPLPTSTPTLMPSPSSTPTSIPSFEFLSAIIGILAAMYLIRQRG